MLAAVADGHTYTVYADAEPLAVVVPYGKFRRLVREIAVCREAEDVEA
jgi:antitoxin (DNA-binding transcriptional repressor) of toxin-antitoxin stability system